MGERFVARNSRAMHALGLLGVLAILAMLVAPDQLGLSPKPDLHSIRWPLAALLGLAAWSWGSGLFDGGDQLVVDRGGILWRTWSDRMIPWSAIRSCHAARKRKWRDGLIGRRIALFLHHPDLHPPTTFRGRLFGRPWNLRVGHITIYTTALDRDGADIVAAIERFAPGSVELHIA